MNGRRAAVAAPAGSGVVNWERLLACLLAILAPLGVVVAIILRYPVEMHQLWQRLLTP